MAQIVTNDLAPEEEVEYAFADGSFKLGPGGSFETDDVNVLASASAHPWLTVERDPGEEYVSQLASVSVDPTKDPLSRYGPTVAFDLEEVRKVEEAKFVERSQPVAIEAGLDQSEVHFEGAVAETHAAAEEQEAEVEAEVADDKTEGEK